MQSVLSGFFHNTALLQKSGQYRTVKRGVGVFLHPNSSMFQQQPPPRLVCFHELARTSKDYIRCVTEIERSWLLEIAPHLYKEGELADTTKKMPKTKAAGKAASAVHE